MPCYDEEIPPQTNMELWWNNTSVFLRNEQQISRSHYVPTETQGKDYMGLLTDFKKKMQQTELHSRHLIQVEVHVNSLLLKHHRYNKCGYDSALT